MFVFKIVTTCLIVFMMLATIASCLGKKGTGSVVGVWEIVYIMSLIAIWG